MTSLDEQHEDLRDGRGGGARMNISDPRVSAALNWVWTALGGLALLIGVGMYNKLSNMNDTLLIAVSKLETQGSQIVDLRNDVSKLREENAVLRTQIAVIEGKVQRGIQEFIHGR
jgi:hypothetical protein